MPSTLTVLGRAPNYDLTTLEHAKMHLNIAASETSNDEKLRFLIEQASATIGTIVGRPLRAEHVREVIDLDGHDSDVMVLQRKPIANLISVACGETELEEVTDYTVDTINGMLVCARPGRWWHRHYRHFGTVTVEYVGGFSLESLASESSESEATLGVPMDPSIERACLLLLGGYYVSPPRDATLRSIEIPGVITKTFSQPSGAGGSGNVDPVYGDVCKLLHRYKLVVG